jgi:DNA-directed RNA polymerase subunit beta'
VKINDKHIEVIVRQMLQKWEILDSGETTLLKGEHVDKAEFDAMNEKALADGRRPAEGEPILLGITKASLQTRSFISAASFQETTRVLTEASVQGKRKLIITPEVAGELRADLAKEYLISKGKHISVHSGDRVRAGEAMMDGAANPHDILKVLGEKELARYLVDETQEVYRLQGVKINDKHIEVIVRQMLRRVRVSDVGDTEFLIDEQVEKWLFEEENEKAMNAGRRPAVGEPLLLGITKASLSTESFISASSFQETTKVLTEAAISGKVDYLRGLKENVIMGRLIPAGTGLSNYKHLDLEVESPADEIQNMEDALAATHGDAASMQPPASGGARTETGAA